MPISSPGRLVLDARHLARWVRRRMTPQRAVLLYHRVADAATDPWELCVTPEHFAEHMDVLAERGWAAPLTDVARGRGHRAVAVTFDDGYADDLYAAAPVLEARGVPATVFVATDTLDVEGGYRLGRARASSSTRTRSPRRSRST